jgi:hypothetical protein
VNPKHLDPINDWENAYLGLSFSAENARKEYCPKGHEYTPENTTIEEGGGRRRRRCRECRVVQRRESDRRRRRHCTCESCGKPASSPVCQECRIARAKSARAEQRAVRQAAAIARREQRTSCPHHPDVMRVRNSRGRYVCNACRRTYAKPINRNRYKDRRARGLCAQCGSVPSTSYRCERCHAIHMASTHARRTAEAAARRQVEGQNV